MISKKCLFVLSLWYSVFANISSAAWTIQTVDSIENGVFSAASSIALDATGKAYIIYRVGSVLKYATNASGAWVTTTVSSDVYDAGDSSSMKGVFWI